MPAATASVAGVSGTNQSGQSRAQCPPVPLPALGTQSIIQGNGTDVGTVISLQCPAKHKLVGSELRCVLAVNSVHWVGDTYCKPLSPFEDFGFRVAVLASIVSLAIIFIMSIAFITCCLLDCIKEDDGKKQDRESDLWQSEEQVQHRMENESHYSHKGRNNNNNNTTTQEKVPSLWDVCGGGQRVCRSQGFTNGSSSLAALPGQDCAQPLLPGRPEAAVLSGPLSYAGPPLCCCQASGVGPDRPHQPPTTDGSNTGKMRPVKEFPIRVISV